jgi:peptidoglycan/LPS O-acetylase OafA/YrhL
VSRLPHRPGLDGLRALAVAAVLLYHGGVPAAPGGFLGVDVFFVLSGYLITSLLLAEHRATGAIALGRFWLRRARRLLPAALAVIGVCLLVTAVFLPSGLPSARGDALASVFYVNNWHQILEDRSYFAAFGRPSLLQHLWSLSVEEQFYLLWPLLLWAGLRRLGRARTLGLTLLGVVASAGLMALLHHPGEDPSRVYYGTDTRAAPLLLGAALAFAWPAARLTTQVGRGARGVLDGAGALGLAALVVAVVAWHDYQPALYAWGLLAVAVAAAAVVAAVAHPATRLGAALGARPLTWIGARSYGIYLWHWPVMALTRPGIDVAASRWILVPAQVAAAVGLAALSYRFLEQPIRQGRVPFELDARLRARAPRQRLALVSAGAVAVLAVGTWTAVRATPPAGPGARLAEASGAARAAPASRPVSAPAPAGAVVAAHGPVLAVGASVMLAAQPALERRLGDVRVDARVGRQAKDIIARLGAYRRAGRLPARVVVQIGENGPLYGADLRRLRRVLDGVPRVVLVNVRVPRSWEDQVDRALTAGVASWSGARLADWRDASARGGLLWDGAHPNPAGARVYARVVARALRS